MKRFAIIGVSGYIARQHLEAIRAIGGDLVAAVDPHDNVGFLDEHYPRCQFFTEFERFDRHIDKDRREGRPLDYAVVCSPNYLHDSHCRWAMRIGANVICEKPLTLNPWNLDALSEIEGDTGRRVHPILQLRFHPQLGRLMDAAKPADNYLDVTYTTPRGAWYDASWKSNEEKSGGLLMNIGVHLVDVAISKFGPLHSVLATHSASRTVSGALVLQKARMRYRLSIDGEAQRVFALNGTALDFSSGFTTLHTRSYEEIMAGRGFSIEDARPAIEAIHAIRIGKRAAHAA